MLPPVVTTVPTKVALAQVWGVVVYHTLSVSHSLNLINTLFYISLLAVFLLGWAKDR
jgi:hypothetical protein